ncbi:MAG: DUF5706 domain-containing protein [Christensenellaceae bacterium]
MSRNKGKENTDILPSFETIRERSEYVNDQINSWIENADSKVSVSCAIFTGVFGVITFVAERYSKDPKGLVVNSNWQLAYHVLFVLSIVVMSVSILAYIFAINPNLGTNANNNNAQKKKFPIYFGDIAAYKLDEYLQAANVAEEKDFVEELQRESHYNAGVCVRKMRRYKCGLWLSFASIALATLSWLSHYLMYI